MRDRPILKFAIYFPASSSKIPDEARDVRRPSRILKSLEGFIGEPGKHSCVFIGASIGKSEDDEPEKRYGDLVPRTVAKNQDAAVINERA